MTTGEIIHTLKEKGISLRLKGAQRLQVIAKPEDLSDERKAWLKAHSPALRAYLVREHWIEQRFSELFLAACKKDPDIVTWSLRTPHFEMFMELCEQYQNAPIGSAADEVKWRERIDAMLVEYITERKRT